MPTPHPRIAVIRDPELDRALKRAERALGQGRSAASLVRELALAGASGLPDGPASELDRALDERGLTVARRPAGDARRLVAELGPVDRRQPRRGSEVLADVRSD